MCCQYSFALSLSGDVVLERYKQRHGHHAAYIPCSVPCDGPLTVAAESIEDIEHTYMLTLHVVDRRVKIGLKVLRLIQIPNIQMFMWRGVSCCSQKRAVLDAAICGVVRLSPVAGG